MMYDDDDIIMDGPVAYMKSSESAVFFSKNNSAAGTFNSNGLKGTPAPIRKLMNILDVALWGEDNRFPQNIEQQMAYCGIGKAALGRKARRLWGNGIMAGKITGYQDDGSEIFSPLQPKDNMDMFKMMNSPQYYRFWTEYLLDWSWFGNTFPEAIFSKDGKIISGWVHQESCDCRFQQMNEDGDINSVLLTKMWGMSGDQFSKFDPKKVMRGLIQNPVNLENIPVDNKLIKQLDCADMYNPIESLRAIADKQLGAKGLKGFKSAIVPNNYPSPNKTYYQLPAWDGARLSGWVEIACKIPSLIKTMYAKAFNIKYHIQIPEKYFEKKYGIEEWEKMSANGGQSKAKKKLLTEMNDFLSGSENAFKTFLSFFDIDNQTNKEYGLIKIDNIENKSNIDKELMTTTAANVEICMAMDVHPSEMSAGSPSSSHQSGGGSGSDIREAGLNNTSLLHLERQLMLSPLYITRDFNNWDSDIVFRVRDVVLTTLDKGTGTQKKVS